MVVLLGIGSSEEKFTIFCFGAPSMCAHVSSIFALKSTIVESACTAVYGRFGLWLVLVPSSMGLEGYFNLWCVLCGVCVCVCACGRI